MSDQQKFIKPIDDVLLVASVLKRLGAGKLTSLSERIKCQKIQYFAQVMKVSIPYTFGLYLHGPYSPDLARDLFMLEKESFEIRSDSFVSEEIEERFAKLKQLMDRITEIRLLEITATIHWLKSAGYTTEMTDKKVSELKQASAEELHKAHLLLGEFL